MQRAESQPDLNREPGRGASITQRDLVAALEERANTLTQELQFIGSPTGLVRAIAERPDLHEYIRREINRGGEPDLVTNVAVGTRSEQDVLNEGGEDRGVKSRNKRREGHSDGDITDPMLRVGGFPYNFKMLRN